MEIENICDILDRIEKKYIQSERIIQGILKILQELMEKENNV